MLLKLVLILNKICVYSNVQVWNSVDNSFCCIQVDCLFIAHVSTQLVTSVFVEVVTRVLSRVDGLDKVVTCVLVSFVAWFDFRRHGHVVWRQHVSRRWNTQMCIDIRDPYFASVRWSIVGVDWTVERCSEGFKVA